VNPNVKSKWTNALRSGKYRQGHGVLTQMRKVDIVLQKEQRLDCCLGVLCDLAVREGVIPAPTVDPGGVHIYGVENDRSRVALPYVVMRWAGLSEQDEHGFNATEVLLPQPVPFKSDRDADEAAGARYLTGANDDGYTFPEIADIIEEQL
jgi:hypothetical protein